MISTRDFLIRGMLAGLVAGFLAFGIAYFVGEPSINTAIALEEAAAKTAPAGAGHEEEAGTEISRGMQSTLGLLTGTALLGVVLGGIAGVVTALGVGRLGLTARGTALRVAATGFIVLYAIPFLIYPPNPPAVGNPDTIGERSQYYFVMVGISVAAAVIATLAERRLRRTMSGWHAGLAAAVGYLVVMVVALVALPRYNEVGPDFPAQVLFEFRISSLLTQLVLWLAIGVVLAELVHRLVGDARSDGYSADAPARRAASTPSPSR